MTADQLRNIVHNAGQIIQDRQIYIDEVHQWTYDPAHQAALQHLANHNKVHGVTATPRGALKDILGEPVVDVNLHKVMEGKAIRWITDSVNKGDKDKAQGAVRNYFSHIDVLTSRNIGYYDVDAELRKLDKPELADREALVKQAIARNIYSTWEQKNMLFCSDVKELEKAQEYYRNISKKDAEDFFQHNFVKLRAEITETITGMCAEARMNLDAPTTQAFIKHQIIELERTNPYCIAAAQFAMDNPHGHEPFMQEYKAIVKGLDSADLVNALFREKLSRDIELIAIGYVQGKGIDTMHELIAKGAKISLSAEDKAKSVNQAQLQEWLRKNYGGLTTEEYGALAQEACKALECLKAEPVKYNVTPEAMRQMGAQYTVLLEKPAQPDDPRLQKLPGHELSQFEGELEAAKAKLRLGLCHHVLNNDGLVTGVSIKDVLSSQHIFTGNSAQDPLNNPMDAAQAYGRAIRTGWGVAHAYVTAPYGTTILRPTDMTKSGKEATEAFERFQVDQVRHMKHNNFNFAKEIVGIYLQGKADKKPENEISAEIEQFIEKKIKAPSLSLNNWDEGKTALETTVILSAIQNIINRRDSGVIDKAATKVLSETKRSTARQDVSGILNEIIDTIRPATDRELEIQGATLERVPSNHQYTPILRTSSSAAEREEAFNAEAVHEFQRLEERLGSTSKVMVKQPKKIVSAMDERVKQELRSLAVSPSGPFPEAVKLTKQDVEDGLDSDGRMKKARDQARQVQKKLKQAQAAQDQAKGHKKMEQTLPKRTRKFGGR